MDEQQFKQLMVQAFRGEAPVVLAAVGNEPELVTRGSEENGMTLLHFAGYENGMNLLHLAGYGGQADLSRSLLGRKADVNQRDNQGMDALMAASLAGHCNVIELLNFTRGRPFSKPAILLWGIDEVAASSGPS